VFHSRRCQWDRKRSSQTAPTDSPSIRSPQTIGAPRAQTCIPDS